jgi:hypothetical protein
MLLFKTFFAPVNSDKFKMQTETQGGLHTKGSLKLFNRNRKCGSNDFSKNSPLSELARIQQFLSSYWQKERWTGSP